MKKRTPVRWSPKRQRVTINMVEVKKAIDADTFTTADRRVVVAMGMGRLVEQWEAERRQGQENL